MAITQTTLEELCSQGYGPIVLKKDGAGYVATLAGRSAQLSLDPGTIRVEVVMDVAWPSGAQPPEEVDRRVRNVMAQIATSVPDLVSIDGSRDTGVTISAWVDASSGGPMELAGAVKSVTMLAELMAAGISNIAQALAFEASTADALALATAQERESLELVQRLASDEPAALAPAAASPAPTPTPAATAPAATAPAPPPAPVQVAAPAAAQPWMSTHRVPAAGLQAWASPDASAQAITTLAAGVELRVEERKGAWARVTGSNGWSGWVDGRILGA